VNKDEKPFKIGEVASFTCYGKSVNCRMMEDSKNIDHHGRIDLNIK